MRKTYSISNFLPIQHNLKLKAEGDDGEPKHNHHEKFCASCQNMTATVLSTKHFIAHKIAFLLNGGQNMSHCVYYVFNTTELT